jgi:hypothetical protein
MYIKDQKFRACPLPCHILKQNCLNLSSASGGVRLFLK